MMTTEQTIYKMNQMKLYNMAEKYQQLISNPQYRDLMLEEGVAYLIDAELTGRENRKRIRLLQQAHLRYPAHIEEIDYQSRRTFFVFCCLFNTLQYNTLRSICQYLIYSTRNFKMELLKKSLTNS